MHPLTGTRLILLAVLLLTLFDLGCRTGARTAQVSPPTDESVGPSLRKITFMAGYRPQADLPFVAAYVAQEKGFFKNQNLQVEVEHSAGQDEHLQLLLTGRVEFTTATAAQVIRRRADNNLPVVAIALFTQRGDQAFVALKDSGITTPKEWEGKTVGIKVVPTAEYLGILKTQGIDRSKIKEVPVPFDPRILCERKVDVLPVFLSNEPNLIRKQCGLEVTVWDPADYGVPTLGLTYITREEIVQKDPDLVQRFLRATLQGLAWARSNPDEAIQIVMKYAPGADPEHMRYMMDMEFKAAVTAQTERHGLGWMTFEQWQALHDTLLDLQVIKRPIDVRKAFTDHFLQQVYKDGRLQP